MDEYEIDSVAAIKMIEDIGNQLETLKEMTPGMLCVIVHSNGVSQKIHPVEDAIDTLDACRNALLSKYGKMMWESSDGPIHKPHSKKHIHAVPAQILSEIFDAARQQAYRQALEDGIGIQSSVGEVEQERSAGLLRRLLGKASGRKIRRPDTGE